MTEDVEGFVGGPLAGDASDQQLAEQLKPLPTALDEIATRISRHCVVTGRDAELAGVVEAVRERTFALWRAIYRLAEAAGKGA